MRLERNVAKQIARERIEVLLNRALESMHANAELAQRYVEIAKKIGMRYKVRIPKQRKLFLCRGCKKFLVPGINCRVRIQQKREPHLALTCLECKHVKRIPLREKPQSKSSIKHP
jgi:ribonuclease P protein subunit RPR2